jgi:hypothetical protein
MDLIDLQLAELEADLNAMSSDDWSLAQDYQEERYLYQCLQLILLEQVHKLPETQAYV